MLGRNLILPHPAKRIVSLFPSQTYLLWSLGLDREVLGITRFCKYPSEWKQSKKRVGGTKDFHFERIAALNPDLILANKEENTKEGVEKLARIFPVYVSEVISEQDNIRWIRDIGILTGKERNAQQIIDRLNAQFQIHKKNIKPLKTAYFIWKDPYMLAGKNTFIDTMLSLNGFENIALENEARYPALSLDTIAERNPQLILLASEPYPFKEKHRLEIQKFFPRSLILNVSGEPFTWFGSYPLTAFDYFSEIRKKINHALQGRKT